MRALEPISFAYCSEFGIGNPSVSAQGTVLTNAIGASNADGTAVQIGSGALTHDCELLEVIVTDCTGDASGTDSSALLDILIDPAGGTSWDTTNRLIQSLQVGYLVTNANSGTATARKWLFPLWIKSGASFAGIGRTVIGSAQSATVFLRCWGGVNRPSRWWCGQKVDAVGDTRASSTGTSVTPNASANTWGSWTSVGSATARRYGYLTASVSMNAAASSSYSRQMQIGAGSTLIGGTYDYATSSLEQVSPYIDGIAPSIYADIPEGTQLQARCRGSSASTPANSIIIYGVAA